MGEHVLSNYRIPNWSNIDTSIAVEGEKIEQNSPATALTQYQRLSNALQTDPRCAQEVCVIFENMRLSEIYLK